MTFHDLPLYQVINTLFTAVTFHELFKEAALNGNEKLEFGQRVRGSSTFRGVRGVRERPPNCEYGLFRISNRIERLREVRLWP